MQWKKTFVRIVNARIDKHSELYATPRSFCTSDASHKRMQEYDESILDDIKVLKFRIDNNGILSDKDLNTLSLVLDQYFNGA